MKQISVFLIILTALGLLSIGINKPFFGHHDWNGVFFGNIVRNTLRFGFFETKFGAVHTFLPQGKLDFSFYTHYPPIFHLLLGLEAKILGVHEWSMRLLSIVMSLTALFYFYKITYLLLKEKTAIIASLFFVVNPMFLYFGKMPIHEVFGLAFVAFAIYRYIIFFKKENKKNLCWLIMGLILACQTVWSGYYLTPLFIVHYSLFRNKDERNNKFYLLILIPILSFLSHLLHTYILTGIWDNGLFKTMFFRMQIGAQAAKYSFTLKDYFKQEVLWLTVFYTRILCSLSLIYGLVLFRKLLTKNLDRKDGLLILMIIFPFIDLIIFRNVCYIHDYKLYYFLLTLPLFGSAGLFYLLNKTDKLWSKNKIISWFFIILIFILGATERLKFTKALLLSSMNKPAYDLGLIVQKRTQENELVLVGSPSFGEFMNFFLNYYGQRKVVYFESKLKEFEQVITKEARLAVFVKNKEKPSAELENFLERNYQSITNDQFIIFDLKSPK